MVYHALGREQDSNAALAGLIAKHGTVAAYQIAQVYAFREECDESFEWLERAYKQRDAGLAVIKTDPLFKKSRHDPRYTDLLKKMHFRLREPARGNSCSCMPSTIKRNRRFHRVVKGTCPLTEKTR